MFNKCVIEVCILSGRLPELYYNVSKKESVTY